MGTRCLTVFKDSDGKEIAVMYRQFDGYPEGHGEELRAFVEGIKLVNGIPVGSKERMANGMGCLAAQIVAKFKGGVDGSAGLFYLYPAGTRDCGEEYIYTVEPDGDKVKVTTKSVF